jgi:hypothetical protein
MELNTRTVTTVQGIVKLCGVCGRANLKDGAIYRASEGRLPLREFPALECEVCGHMEPDSEKILALPPKDVPSSLRIRCAERHADAQTFEDVATSAACRRISNIRELHPDFNARRPSGEGPHR